MPAAGPAAAAPSAGGHRGSGDPPKQPQHCPREPPQPSTHQLQLLLLPLLEPGQVLGQLGAAELVPQAPGDAQHLPGDATEGHGDLVHQLPVPREVIAGGTAQVCPVAPADRPWGEKPLSPHAWELPELSPLCHPPQAAPGGFSCPLLPGFGSMSRQPHPSHGTGLETAFFGGESWGFVFFSSFTLSALHPRKSIICWMLK